MRKFLKYGLVVLFCFFVIFICGEIIVRMFRPGKTPGWVKANSLKYEPSLFARHILKAQKSEVIGKFNYKWNINEKGYRGENFYVTKPQGVTRIMFYGGSSTFNIYSPKGLDWPRQVENILKKKGLDNIEIINAGTPGHASFDSLGKLFAEGHLFSPDYVVLYNAWNDIKYFRHKEPLLRTKKPSLKCFDPRTSYLNFFDKILCNISQLYIYLRSKYYYWKKRIGSEGIIDKKSQYIKQLPKTGIKQYKINVQMFCDMARNINTTPVLMTQARLVAPDNSEEQKKLIAYDMQKMNHDLLCEAFEHTDNILKTVAKEKNALFIDVSKKFTGSSEIMSNHVHFSTKGAKKMAEFIAGEFVNILQRN